jgi:hypothetical protein
MVVAWVIAAVVVGLIVAEIVVRIACLPDPWTKENFAVYSTIHRITDDWAQLDPVIGYIPRVDYRGDLNTHGPMGVRLPRTLAAGEPSPPVPTGGILVVGDSFAYGVEARDNESWPAQLEGMLKVPVVNGACGGWGIDQMVLRIEQLFDTAAPKVVIVSLIPGDIERNEYSVIFNQVKPYFDVVDGKLELRNVPVPEYRPTAKPIGLMRSVLGHSYLALWIADRLGARWRWIVFPYESAQQVHHDGDEVSRLLWRRLADRIKGTDLRVIVVAQYLGIEIADYNRTTGEIGKLAHPATARMDRMLAGAREAGFLTLDTYEPLRRTYETDEASFWDYYVKHPMNTTWRTGHMTAAGNRVIADMIAAFIRGQVRNV